MDIFKFRDGLVADYADYVKSFIRIRDGRVRESVETSLQQGILWPKPLLQLNPSFETGEPLDEPVEPGELHEACSKVFRVGKDEEDPFGKPMYVHRHQVDAIGVAGGCNDNVVTTGTDSGKSLTYIVPIVDHVLRAGSGKGLKAIIVYPTNPLANSQAGELEKFFAYGLYKPLATFRRFMGQESLEEQRDLIENPPDVLLTNYVILELILTRPQEWRLFEAPQASGSWCSTSCIPTGLRTRSSRPTTILRVAAKQCGSIRRGLTRPLPTPAWRISVEVPRRFSDGRDGPG